MQKLPPIEKIPEAWGAIADKRVLLLDHAAEVRSSNGQKTYFVCWQGDAYTSTDSATYWQGYAGYPILAVLMLQGKLPLNLKISAHFAAINWAELNRQHNRNYGAALSEILSGLRQKGIDTAPIVEEMQRVHHLLSALSITAKRGRNKHKSTNS